MSSTTASRRARAVCAVRAQTGPGLTGPDRLCASREQGSLAPMSKPGGQPGPGARWAFWPEIVFSAGSALGDGEADPRIAGFRTARWGGPILSGSRARTGPVTPPARTQSCADPALPPPGGAPGGGGGPWPRPLARALPQPFCWHRRSLESGSCRNPDLEMPMLAAHARGPRPVTGGAAKPLRTAGQRRRESQTVGEDSHPDRAVSVLPSRPPGHGSPAGRPGWSEGQTRPPPPGRVAMLRPPMHPAGA